MDTSRLRKRYYSAEVYAQTLIQSFFPNSHSPMEAQDHGFGDTGVSHHRLPNSELLPKNC